MRQYDFNELAALTQGQAATNSQQPKKKKNFFVDQISTATGIAGGLLGARGGMAGAGIGSGLGSGLGEAIENALTGESLSKNVLKEAAIGGVMGAGPLKLLKGGAALAGGKGMAGAAIAAQTPLRATAGKAVTGAADDLAIKNFRLTPTQLTNFQNKFGEDAGQVIRKYGFQNVDDIAAKGIEPLQQTFDDAVQAIPGVTKDSLRKNLMKRINKLSQAAPNDTKMKGVQLKKEADDLLKGYGDVIDAKELNGIRRQFDDLVNYTEKASNPARYDVNKRMADGIRETLQKADPTGQLKDVGRELQKLRQLADVTAKQGNLGRGSLPLNLPTLIGGTMGAGAGGPVGAAGMAIGTAAVNSNAGRRVAMAGAEKLGSGLTQSGARAAAGGAARGLPLRVGLSGLASGMANQAQPQTLESALVDQSLANNATNPMNMPNAMNPRNAQNIDELSQTEEDMSSPFSPSNVNANIQQILANGGDIKDVADYISVVKSIQELQPQDSADKPLNQGQQERADLIKAIGMTEDAMSGGSINYGPIGSRVEGIKGMFNKADPETLAYKNIVSGLRAAITKARAGASLTEGELKMLKQYTPTDTDSEQVVRSKLTQLRNLYGNEAPTGGGSTLEDALMQYQSIGR
jgi:hypothetical protein